MLNGMTLLALGLAAVLGYLLGSVNCAIITSRLMFGKDVRTMGSGNAGMTNVLRNFGKKGAALTMLGDTGKGVLGVFAARWLVMLLVPGTGDFYGDTLQAAYIGGIVTILGHMFPLYFGFKGGKGISTSLGVIAALQPVVAAILLAIFLVVLAISKMVSLGSVIGISCYPVVTLLWCLFVSHRQPVFSTICAAIVAALVVWMHRENVKRILNGTEYKFGQKKREAQEAGPEKA